MVVGCALDPSSRGIPCSEAAAEQRIGTDEVHADGRGPSPLNSVLSVLCEASDWHDNGCNRQSEAVMNRHGAPISRAPNQVSGSPRMASGSKGRRGPGHSVGSPTSVASPRAAQVFRHSFRLSSRAGRESARMRVVAPNKQTDNNGLERTRSRANGLTGPCRSTQCYLCSARQPISMTTDPIGRARQS